MGQFGLNLFSAVPVQTMTEGATPVVPSAIPGSVPESVEMPPEALEASPVTSIDEMEGNETSEQRKGLSDIIGGFSGPDQKGSLSPESIAFLETHLLPDERQWAERRIHAALLARPRGVNAQSQDARHEKDAEAQVVQREAQLARSIDKFVRKLALRGDWRGQLEEIQRQTPLSNWSDYPGLKECARSLFEEGLIYDKIEYAAKLKSALGSGVDFTDLIYSRIQRLIDTNNKKRDPRITARIFGIRDAFKGYFDLRKCDGYEIEVARRFGNILVDRDPEDGLFIPRDFPEVDLYVIMEGVVFLLTFDFDNAIRPAQLDKVDRMLELYGDSPGIKRGIERTFLELIRATPKRSQDDKRHARARTIKEHFGKAVDFGPLINASLLAALRRGDWQASQQKMHHLFEKGKNPMKTVGGCEDAAREGLTGLLDSGAHVEDILSFMDNCEGVDFSKIDSLTELCGKAICGTLDQTAKESSHRVAIDEPFTMIDEFNEKLMPPGLELMSIPGFRSSLEDLFCAMVSKGETDRAAFIKDRFGSDIDFQPLIENGFLESLRHGQAIVFLQIDRTWGKEIAFRRLAGYDDAVREGFYYLLTHQNNSELWPDAEVMKVNFGEGVDLSSSAQRAFCHFIEQGGSRSDHCEYLARKFCDGVDLSSVAMFEKYLTGNSRSFYLLLKKRGEEKDFLKVLPRFGAYLGALTDLSKKLEAGEEWKAQWRLDDIDMDFLAAHPLAAPISLHWLGISSDFSHQELGKREGDEKYRYLWEKSKEAGLYNDVQMIQRFEEGALVFGHKAMFEYVGTLASQEWLHLELIIFDAILKLYSMSKLKPHQFYGNILNQVRMDDGAYVEESAHGHMNAVASALKDADFAGILEEARTYQNIPELQELVQLYHEPSDVFQSWKHLKKFYELQQMLGRKEILEQLLSLGDSPLARYVRTLAFHPGVDAGRVFMLLREPESFWELGATHTPPALHDLKKPSNYTRIPHLDLTAADMRDALVEGVLDRLQTWRPFTVEYRASSDMRYLELSALSTQQLLSRAVGSYKTKVAGEAADAAQLMRTVAGLFGETEKGRVMRLVVDIIGGRKILSPEDDLRVRNTILFDGSGYGLEVSLIRAKISLKSDPDAVVAGNDVVDCMPFGDGKSVLYTCNPICGQLTVQKKNGDGRFRTVAQSLLTRDMFFGGDEETRTVDQIVSAMQNGNTHLADLMDERVLCQTRPHTLACDSIEKNRNFSNPGLLKRIYQDFFHRYLRWKGQPGTFDQDKVVTSTTFNVLGHLPTEPNRYVPLAPMSYSDMVGGLVAILNVSEPVFSGAEVIPVEVQGHYMDRRPELQDPRLAYLTHEDTLPVTYIEGKAYSDNDGLLENLHNMENALIATGINNVAKSRPNMSLKYVDEKGFMRGYFLAYQGRFNPAHGGTNDAIAEGEEVIYVADIARLPGHDGAGIAMLYGFLEMYKREYLDRGNLIPVFAKFREGTSYRFITRMLPRLSRRLGFELEVVEIGGGKVGQDTMHWAVVRPARKKSLDFGALNG